MWLSDIMGVGMNSLMESIESFVGMSTWESHNFLDDEDIRLVDLFGLWNPLAVNFVLKSLFGWSNLIVVLVEIFLDILTEILISLSGSSPVVGNFFSVLELEGSGMLVGSWGVFSLGNLIVPGSSVHVLDLFRCLNPFLLLFLESSSGTVGVLEVSFKILFDIPF